MTDGPREQTVEKGADQVRAVIACRVTVAARGEQASDVAFKRRRGGARAVSLLSSTSSPPAFFLATPRMAAFGQDCC